MVPISLQLTNFLSYSNGVAPLDFTQFHTACLSGNNGNGKSALLDAMTWAVWGEARHSAPNLLRIGASEMRVEFVFDLDGERFRVVRGYSKNRRSGVSTLEVHVSDAASGLFRTITRPSLRESEEQLRQLLRMDYDTFINSAYLRQGQADKFSRQPPAQRKQILAEILGLSHYQEIADRARAELRSAEANAEKLETQIESIENFLAGRASAQQLFDHYTQLLADLTPRIAEAEGRLTENRARKVRLEEKRKRAEAIADEISGSEYKRGELQAARSRLLQRKMEIDEWQAQGDAIVSDFQAHGAAKAAADKWQAVYETWRQLTDEGLRLKERIAEAGKEFQRRNDDLQARCEHEKRLLDDGAAQTARADEIREGSQRLEEARRHEAECAENRAAHDRAMQEVRAAEDALRARANEIEVKLHTLDAQITGLQHQAARADEAQRMVAAADAQLQRLEEANTRLQDLLEERNGHEARLTQLKQHVESAKAEIAANEQKLKILLANPQAQCPLCDAKLGEHGREHIQEKIEDEIAALRSRIEEYTSEGRLLQKKKAALDGPITEMQAYSRDAPRLHANAAMVRRQLEDALQAQQKIGELQAERERVEALHQSGDFAAEETARLKAAKAAQEKVAYDPDAHAAIARRVNELSKFDGELAALREAEKQMAAAKARLANLEPELSAVAAQLASRSYAADDSAEMERLKAQRDRLEYDKTAHVSARQELQRLDHAPQRYEKFKTILARAADVEADLAASAQAITDIEARLAELCREQESLKDIAAQIATCERALQEARGELDAARAEERDANTELGRQRAVLELCAQREEERAALDEQRKAAAHQAFILNHTAKAFGKDGIQALIIENAIPELQDDANQILRRLTRNHMQISMESLREKQTGGLRETLDIKISDERGTREYLMFSGGEAFRADFALRIALSKLLARRAGAQLRTLIIDEGFGTQDNEGLQQMIECIQAISPDFDKVLVVTHLDAIKNAFPTRIEVTKEPDTGSRYEIIM